MCGCGNYPKVQNLFPVERLETMNGTPSTSLQQLTSELCPMGAAECMLNSPECEEVGFTASEAATALQSLVTMKTQCTQLGTATDYAEAYVFPSPSSCPSISDSKNSQSGALGDHKGVALISEFCGCSSVLTGAFKINPWNTGGVLTALDEAISITKEDQAERFLKDHSYVSSQTLVQWVHKNLSELKVTRSSNLIAARTSMAGPPHIQEEEVVSAYRNAKKRAIFLDNEGTIAAKARWQMQSGNMMSLQKDGTPPDPQVLDLLQTLVNDRGNTVVVLSGRTKEVMQEWFSSVDGLGLCAEHGFHRFPPRTLCSDMHAAWRSEGISDDNQEWKNLAVELIQQYVKRIQGSIIEVKACAISWNYREVGAAGVIDDVALELMRFLDPESPMGLLHGYPVKVFMGKGYVEVKRKDIDKGAACIRTLEELGPVDFVLCVGDDRSDEDMFEAMSQYFHTKADTMALSSALSQCSSVGFKKSAAGSLASLDAHSLGECASPAESTSPTASPKDRPRPPLRTVAFNEDSIATQRQNPGTPRYP
eukprot:s3724_g2.t1